MAEDMGFSNISEYVRFLHNQVLANQNPDEDAAAENYRTRFPKRLIRPFHQTNLGEMIWGDSRAYLFNGAKADSVDLIMTSPPFGLVRKKSYGNEDADEYCNWFRPFAEGFKRVLKDEGSLVIDIGGAWVPGQPTRSLYHFKLLVMLVEEYGFHLCQEHYWWNPAKLPTPAEWVNVRRVRVKDAINTVWWLSKTPFPKANNRRVLAPYSKSMKDLLRNGYTAKLRPSGHDISSKFQKDNGGSVPPNLLAIANTESSSRYQEYCRENNIPIHPARFPPQLPEYFIRFLTDKDGHAAPVLQLAEHALDKIAPTVFLAVVRDRYPAVALGRDDRLDACCFDLGADGAGVIALVGQQGLDTVGGHPEQRPEALDVVRLAGRQDEAEGPAVSVASGMELGGEAAARAAKPLVLLIPLFSPTAQ
jgi:DNA modification methylase